VRVKGVTVFGSTFVSSVITTISRELWHKGHFEMSQASSRAASVIPILSDPPLEAVEHVSSVDASNHPAAAELFSHILVPQICAERKSQYTSPQSSRIVPKIDEIIGEYEYGGHLWYFTRFEGGIASRVRFLLS